MDALRLEDKIQILEARINMALEMGTLSLERIDELRNKIKFAIDQEIKSEDDMDVEDEDVNILGTLSRTYNEWFNESTRSADEIDNIGEFLFIFVRLLKSQMGSSLNIDRDVRKSLNRFFDCDGALRIRDESSVKDILNIVENTLKMKINRDFPSDEKNDTCRDSEENIIGRRRSSSWSEGRSREEKVSRSASPRYYSGEQRDQSPCVSITSSCVKGDEEL